MDYFCGGGGLEYTTVDGRPESTGTEGLRYKADSKTYFDEEVLRTYLDGAIRTWREKRNEAEKDSEHYNQACDYVDAFQSVRKSILGELLP